MKISALVYCSTFEFSKHNISRVLVQELKDGQRIFEDFVDDGLIEYLDVNEMNDAIIAVYENDVHAKTTHLEVLSLSP